MIVLKNGNIGIGITIPQRKFHISEALRLEPISSPPPSPSSGDMYYDTSEALCIFSSGSWILIAGVGSCA